MRRIASVIGIPAESVDEYERLHAEAWPEVLAALTAGNVRNYSIFRQGDVLFSYFEYVGDDFDADMARVNDDPATKRWHALTDALQRPLPERADGDRWMPIPEVFHLD
ncbi:L-rhamnose mutarotase [Diaminobutyricibacter sp. McL0608]|uniref:L-rhamnose mutarotase n=1 Tax=Leifsonia sp. McL0608 TaxID=3143537 RepID=UPI0031F2E3FE